MCNFHFSCYLFGFVCAMVKINFVLINLITLHYILMTTFEMVGF